jgi:hypothetical protein
VQGAEPYKSTLALHWQVKRIMVVLARVAHKPMNSGVGRATDVRTNRRMPTEWLEDLETG